MNCFRPKRIRNKYNEKYLYVPCRECDACKINALNQRAIQLAEDMKKYKYAYFIRLGYDNDSVPYIMPGCNGVFRNAEYVHFQGKYVWSKSDFPIRLDDFDTTEVDFRKCKHLRKHFVSDSVGVLYYKDIQNFIKRLRKRYGKERINFRYSVGFEYGPRTFRPHMHVILYGNDSRIKTESFKTAVVESWPLQNWFTFGLCFNEELYKRCDARTAYYIASYVNGGICSTGVSEIKRFRPKVVRSKSIAFGIDDESQQRIEDFILGKYDSKISRIGGSVFEIFDFTELSRVSSRPIPSRYFNAFFPKFKGYGQVSFSEFKTRARFIYNKYRNGKIKEELENGFLSSMDINFMCGFERYKSVLFHRKDINKNGHFSTLEYDDEKLFDSYLMTHDVASRLYNSLCLKFEMMDYERIGKKEYFLRKINTSADDLEKRIILISNYCGSPQSSLDLVCPPGLRSDLHNKCNKYYYKLLPKHFNQYSFDFV